MVWVLFERLALNTSLIITLAYLVSKIKIFKKTLRRQASRRDKFLLVCVFGAMGIAGTFTGIEIKGALANSRVVGVVAAGLLGGPLMGIGAGVLAGAHHALLGGFTAFSCGVATILEGLFAGLIGRKIGGKRLSWKQSLSVGMAAEVLQMLVILLLTRPFEQALDLVKVIGMPMIIINGIGIAIFIGVVQTALEEEEQIGALQAQKALQIANQTLPILREGLNENTALRVAQIIYKQTDMAAVALTDREKILAHVGKASDHHKSDTVIQTRATWLALESGELRLADSPEEIGCREPNCPLSAALVVPLKVGDRIIGTLKVYREHGQQISPVDWEFGAGLGMLFSTQLEVAELEERAQLVTKAELKALQAQINPHFLFNAINTIVSFCRTDPEKARQLLLRLGDFFRKNLQSGEKFVTLQEECEHVHSYLSIEQARFSDRLQVEEKIEEGALSYRLPGLTLQPLVENALKHGVYPGKGMGIIQILAWLEPENLVIQITDNGAGISPEKLEQIRQGVKVSTNGLGIGIQNIAQRLKYVYHNQAQFSIDSELGEGTRVTLTIPRQLSDNRRRWDDESPNC
jgi:two-component system sensor histidine kinase LytS